MKLHRFLAAALAAASLALVAGPSPSLAGEKAPEIHVKEWLNSDQPLSLEKLKGKVVILEFWATWCGPCVATIPHLKELWEKEKDKGVVLISCTDEPMKTVKPFVQKMGMKYPIALDDGGRTNGAYGIKSIPHAFIIDPSGEVAWRGHPGGGALEAALAAVMKKTPPTEGPVVDPAKLKQEMETADRHLASGDYAKALKILRAVAELKTKDSAEVKAAKIKLDEIEKGSQADLDAAIAKANAKDYAGALESLQSVHQKFTGLPAADKAVMEIARMEGDPAIAAAMKAGKEEAEAKKQLEEGVALLEEKKTADGYDLLDRCATAYPETESGKKAREKADEIKNDAARWKEISEKLSGKEAKRLLNMAQNWLNAGNKAKAREYFDQVIAKFPGTPYAKEAEAAMK